MTDRALQAIAPAAYQGLRSITWNRDPDRPIPAAEVVALYERNWRHLDHQGFEAAERDLIAELTLRFGGGTVLT